MDNPKPPKAIGTAIKGGKHHIIEFDVAYFDGKPFAVIGKIGGGRIVEYEPLDPACLKSKSDPFDLFYIRELNLDKRSN